MPSLSSILLPLGAAVLAVAVDPSLKLKCYTDSLNLTAKFDPIKAV